MKYLFGNWKMYLDSEQCGVLADAIADISFDRAAMTGVVFPHALALSDVNRKVEDTSWHVGIQHIDAVSAGAYTGALSANIAQKTGVRYALVGHSERRHIFGEKNVDIKKQFDACIDAHIVPVLCIGETREDRDNDKVQYRIKKQLYAALENTTYASDSFVVTYEPVWAIGTGSPCLAVDADEVISYIKQELVGLGYEHVAVLYGGSVNAQNVVSYLSLDCIDGVLVGSASTRADEWQKVVLAIQNI